jgi:hypothetical protein
MLLQRLALLHLYTCLPLYHHVSSASVLGRLSSQVRKMRFGGGTRFVDLLIWALPHWPFVPDVADLSSNLFWTGDCETCSLTKN